MSTENQHNINDHRLDAKEYLKDPNERVSQHDEHGNPWCDYCKAPSVMGWHKEIDCPKHEVMNKLMRNELDKRDLRLETSPAYIQDCVVDLKKRVITIENFIGQNYAKDISALKGFYGEYGHRLLNIENAFTEDDIATKPKTLMDEIKRCNKHIERLHKRIDHVEKLAKDPFRYGEKNMPDPDILATVLEQLNNIKQRYGKDDGLSPEAFGVLLARIEKTENFISNTMVNLTAITDLLKQATHEINEIRKTSHKCPLCYGQEMQN